MSQLDFATLQSLSQQYLCDIDHDRGTFSAKYADEYVIKLGFSQVQFIHFAIQ